jgi:hypothetical protein
VAGLSFPAAPFLFADRVTAYCSAAAENAFPTTIDRAVDGNFLTFPRLGSSADVPEGARLRLTVGFP